MKDFNQAYVSSVLSQYFKKDFLKRWDLKEYTSPLEPAVFLGLYTPEDIACFKNHKSYKILYFGGGDCISSHLELVKNTPNVVCIGYGGDWLYKKLDEYNIPYTSTRIVLKDYSEFNPSPLGENIYVYKGIHGNRPDYFKWNEIVEPLQYVFGKDRIIFTEFTPINDLIKNYYEDCFIYVKPNEKGGSTAMVELGYMGRKTITLGHSNFSNCLEYQSLDDIINLIVKESNKIGTTQPQVAEKLNSMFDHEGKWLNINHYNNWNV
jgi:hypothetical protein